MAKANKKASKTVAAETVAAETQTTTSVEPVQLTIADLQLLSRIVDLASRRGAFQAGEMSQVGDAFNKLSGFLAYIESTQKADVPAEATTETATAVA